MGHHLWLQVLVSTCSFPHNQETVERKISKMSLPTCKTEVINYTVF